MQPEILDQYNQLLEKAELAREKGDYAEALKNTEEAVILAAEENLPDKLVNALAQKLIIFKHKFQTTDNPLFNELMYGDIQTGLAVAEYANITGQPKAVMLLRAGDYFFAKESFPQATAAYEQALSLMDTNKKGEYSEYLSHFGLALVMSGEAEQGKQRITEALELAQKDDQLRPFHKLIIISGIFLRLAAASHLLGQAEDSSKYLNEGLKTAKELADRHNMNMRLVQAEKLKKKLGI